MRLALLLLIALSACASKKPAPRSPASPAAPAATEQPKEETGATNVDSDKDADDPKPLSSDPEESGQ